MEKQLSFFAEIEPPARTAAAQSKQMTPPPNDIITIFIDGAARGNPGPAGAGIAITYHNKMVVEKGFYLGKKTNNQAEYSALVLALIFAKKFCDKHHLRNPHFELFSDSELLVKQLKGHYKIKNEALAHLKKIADQFLNDYTHHITHVVREKNKIADKLANLGIDKKNKIPVSLSKILPD